MVSALKCRPEVLCPNAGIHHVLPRILTINKHGLPHSSLVTIPCSAIPNTLCPPCPWQNAPFLASSFILTHIQSMNILISQWMSCIFPTSLQKHSSKVNQGAASLPIPGNTIINPQLDGFECSDAFCLMVLALQMKIFGFVELSVDEEILIYYREGCEFELVKVAIHTSAIICHRLHSQ